MGTISLQSPIVGQPNSTEDPKIPSDLNVIQTVINGNIDSNNVTAGSLLDTSLASPNNTVRRLLLQQTSSISGAIWTPAGQDFVLSSGGLAGQDAAVLMGDRGINGQPADFTVVGKTPTFRVRAVQWCNGFQPFWTMSAGLYPIASGGGGAGAFQFNLGTLVTGSQTNAGQPVVGGEFGMESSAFTLTTGSDFVLGVHLSTGSGTQQFGSRVSVTAQLFVYYA